MGLLLLTAGCRESLPSRGAWIEIGQELAVLVFHTMSLPSRGAWIEIISNRGLTLSTAQSLPSRGAWIEIAIRLRRGYGP